MDAISKYLSDANVTGLRLKFSDKNLESEFWEHIFTTRKRFYELSILIATLATFLTSAKFMPYISEVLSTKSINLDFIVRSFILCPPLIMTFICTARGMSYRIIQFLFLCSAALCGVFFSSLMWFTEAEGIIYYNYSFIHVLVFMCMLLIIPVKNSIPVALFLCVYHVLLAYLVIDDLPVQQVMFILSPCITIFIIMAYAGHAMEKSERFSFLYRRALSDEYENRVGVQEQRTKWLRLITDFLRHELKNSIIGVSSSLELIKRKNNNEDLDGYIQRAGSSAVFMKRLLDEASTSTSLESSLNKIHLERSNLSGLFEERIDEYRDVYDDYTFDSDIEKKRVCHL